MTPDPWTIGAIFLGLFLFMELILFLRRSRKQKDAQEVLRRAKQEAQDLAQLPLSNPHPLVQVSADGRILFANPAAFEAFPGIKEQGLQHPAFSGLETVIRENKPAVREITSGDLTWHQTITPAQAGGQDAFTVYCHDITDRKTYERELQRAHRLAETSRAAAEEANQARGDFLANMSHELRTPMNGIIGLSDILSGARLNTEHKEMAEAVNSSARNLLILLNDLLDFSKIEAGELTMEAIPFGPRKIVEQVRKLQSPVAAHKGLEMKASVAENVPARIIGDPSRLQQILNNLISNALKFTEQGSVTLAVDGEEDGKGHFLIRIAVTDTGIGIPKDKQNAIFEKFKQADTSTARKYGGTGLGLAITKDLAELMGGRVTLESEEGAGTTFTVTFPARIAEGAEEEDSTTGQTPAGINTNAKVMIVDDHPINLLYMRKTLTDLGFKGFDEAKSGKEALKLFADNTYDLILMDCQMPEMDGFEAARQIRTQETAENEPTIIAVTADAMKGAEDKCMDAGMDDYISKPVDKDKLLALLQQWLPGDHTQIIGEMEKDAPQDNPVVFDWSRLADFTDGDAEMEQKIIGIFIENLETDIEKLDQNFRADDHAEWDEMAHKLCGAASHIGANALAAVCDEAQSLSPEETYKMKEIHPLILERYQEVHGLLSSRQAA